MNSPTDELRLMHGASRPVQSAGQGLGLFLTLTRLVELHQTGRLTSFGTMAHLAERRAFLRHLSPVRKKRWVVCAKSPFAGQQAVLAYSTWRSPAQSRSRLGTGGWPHFGKAIRIWIYWQDRHGIISC